MKSGQITIVSAIVLRLSKNDPDKVTLQTDLPQASHPFDDGQSIRFETMPNFAEEWIKAYIGDIPIEVIDVKKMQEKKDGKTS